MGPSTFLLVQYVAYNQSQARGNICLTVGEDTTSRKERLHPYLFIVGNPFLNSFVGEFGFLDIK